MVAKKIRDKAREKFFSIFFEWAAEHFPDVMQIKSNEFTFPIVEDGEEMYITVSVKVPTGTKDEEFDGYAHHEQFEIAQREKAEKAEKKAKEKKKKKGEKEGE